MKKDIHARKNIQVGFKGQKIGQKMKKETISYLSIKKKKAHDPNVPYDGCDEPDDTGQNARAAIGKAWADQ